MRNEDDEYRFADESEADFASLRNMTGYIEDDDLLIVREIVGGWTFEELDLSRLKITLEDLAKAKEYMRKLGWKTLPTLKWYIVATLG
jgi:hypothetical protein